MGKGYYLYCLCSKWMFFNRSSVYCSKSKLLSGLVIQIVSPKVLQESTTILQLKIYIAYVVRTLVRHPPLQECPINLASFLFPFVCNARSLYHQFFSIFSPWSFTSQSKKSDGFQCLKITSDGLGLEGLKVPKVRFSGFWQKSYPFSTKR